ncbi:MAG: hypothetical protein JSS07_12755 [Proteobacteria bacterium]|nr:hypothetical protein [Pseudomonadota bacterium]
MMWAWRLARPDAGYLFGAVLGGVILGALWPINAVVLSKALGVIMEVCFLL